MSDAKNPEKRCGNSRHLTGDEPLSLYGMDPEEALKQALGTPPPKKPDAKACPMCGFDMVAIVSNEGERYAYCPKCECTSTT